MSNAYKAYPKPVHTRSGCKVGWHYYASLPEAEECAKIARHNAEIDRQNGYDHGYCSPGNILGPGHQSFYSNLWEVCTC